MAPPKYDEKVLAPIIMPAEWWYSMSLRDRLAVAEAIGLNLDEIGHYVRVGAIQERLAVAGKTRLRGVFMRAMQAGYDEQKAAEERLSGIIPHWTEALGAPPADYGRDIGQEFVDKAASKDPADYPADADGPGIGLRPSDGQGPPLPPSPDELELET